MGWRHVWSPLLLCKKEHETLKGKKNGPEMVTEISRDLALGQELPSVFQRPPRSAGSITGTNLIIKTSFRDTIPDSRLKRPSRKTCLCSGPEDPRRSRDLEHPLLPPPGTPREGAPKYISFLKMSYGQGYFINHKGFSGLFLAQVFLSNLNINFGKVFLYPSLDKWHLLSPSSTIWGHTCYIHRC